MPLKFNKKTMLSLMTLIALIALIVSIAYFMKPEEVKYTKFLEYVEKDKVERIEIMNGQGEILFYLQNDDKLTYKTANPQSDTFKEDMLKKGIEVENKVPLSEDASSMLSILTSLLIVSLVVVLFISYKDRFKGGHEKVNHEEISFTFKDIAGNSEAKADMMFLVDFLKDPKKYEEIGAKLPKGVVLYGPPGTGKTLMAKAVAGEAKVPFYSVSGSDFVEMYVGLGAKRVRELFKEAKENSPAIIFIDEIDAVGTSRGEKGASNSEKDQTINALLSELDGFDDSSKVIVIAATNRLEDLDEALIRPGRFDRHVSINLPDAEDRLAILKTHAKGKRVSEDVDFESLSHITIGFSGAALESLLNEASIIAVNRGSNVIEYQDIDDSYYKIAMRGNKKENKVKDDEQLKLVAYHEAGHALVTKLLTDNHLHKVTIIPSTSGAGGATFSVPKSMSLISKRDLINNVKVLYGGRAAEEILKGDKDLITSGASGDIQQATRYIQSYFAELGMSEEFGMLGLRDENTYIKEAVKLSKQIYKETLELLKENEDMLDKLSYSLLEHETLTGEEVNEILSGK